MNKNKKILITGAGGFIGSHLVEECIEQGYSVKAFVRYNSLNTWGWLDSLECKNDIEVVAGDIRDFDSVDNALKGCGGVMHLAALIGIPYSYVSPLAYIKTNVEGTYNILQASKDQGIDNVLVTSTSETYGSAQFVPIDEKHPVSGQSPYAASKAGADQLALSYYRSFELPVKIIRPFNTFGPRQSARAIIPAIIIQALSGDKNIKLGNISPSRDFMFVKDTVRAFLAVYSSEKGMGEAFNAGTGKEITIGSLANKIADILGMEINIVTEEQRIRTDKSEVDRLLCDNSKIKELTKWEDEYSIEDGLALTIDWINENKKFYRIGQYVI